MLFEEALAAASRDEGFKATVYAMNTLLIHKGVYTQEEFQVIFAEWVEKELQLAVGSRGTTKRRFHFGLVLPGECSQSGRFAECIPVTSHARHSQRHGGAGFYLFRFRSSRRHLAF